MEKNEFYELLDGIIDCTDKVVQLGRLLKDFVPQFTALLPQEPIEVKAIEAKVTKTSENKKKAYTKKAEPVAEEVKEDTPTFTKRRKNFIKKEWKQITPNTYTRTYKHQDLYITAIGSSYKVSVGTMVAIYYKGKPISDFLSAMYVAFDLADLKSEVLQ